VGLEAASAPCFISFGTADHDPVRRRNESLGVIGGIATAYTDGQSFRDVLGHGQKLRHGLERLAEVVLVQPGHDDSFARVGELIADTDQAGIEELAFVDSHGFGAVVHSLEYLLRGAHELRLDAHVAVGDDVIVAVASVYPWLEDLYTLAGDLSPTRTKNFHFRKPHILFHAFHVFPLEGVDAYLFARLDEVRDLNDQTGLQSCGFRLSLRGGSFDTGFCVHDFENH
jgi:hypothetical protein